MKRQRNDPAYDELIEHGQKHLAVSEHQPEPGSAT
jgi:hypothetical protein